MDLICIPGTEIDVSRVGFGTASLHHKPWSSQRKQLLNEAFNLGVRHFDTSPLYGYGLAESAIGDCFRQTRGKITITTKIGLYPPGWTPGTAGVWARKLAGKFISKANQLRSDWSVNAAQQSFQQSLKRLKTEYVDFLFVHEPEITSHDATQLFEWLQGLKQQGKIRAWGLAGKQSTIDTLVRDGHPISQVVQTEDSLGGKDANWLIELERSLQFTYGYFRLRGSSEFDGHAVLADSLKRNSTGCVLISTRSMQRLHDLLAEDVKTAE